MMRQGPTDSVLASTDLGEMKMPEPMMVPTIMQMPLMRPTCVCKDRANSTSKEFAGPEVTAPLPPAPGWPEQAKLTHVPGVSTLCSCHGNIGPLSCHIDLRTVTCFDYHTHFTTGGTEAQKPKARLPSV